MIPLVIECGDHSFAPYAFICFHLIDNPNLKWCPMEVEDGREVEYDWLCEECLEEYNDGSDLAENITPICINCVRRIRGEG
jgi:hypothetical protein